MGIYRVFHDLPDRSGNLVAVEVLPDGRTATDMPAYPPSLTRCMAVRSGDDRYQVECFQHDRPIQCCGHGLLAVACALRESGVRGSVDLGGGVLAEIPDGSGPLVSLPALAALPATCPGWATRILSIDGSSICPVGADISGAPDGYLLLELDPGVDIASLRVDLGAITAQTRRAVLLWQFDPGIDGLVRTRYFAPQYGNAEDTATGSVLRVLAPLLLHASGLGQFDVIQCSAGGGRMTARNSGGRVMISGHVAPVSNEDYLTRCQSQT